MEINGIFYFVVYHVVGIRVGCTNCFSLRKKQNQSRFGENSIIEILDLIPISLGDIFAGDVEWFYADWFGYNRGLHYSKSNWNVKLTPKQRREAGLVGGNSPLNPLKNATSEQQSEWGKKGFNRQWELGLNPVQTGAATKASLESPNHFSRNHNQPFKTGEAGKAAAASPNHSSKQFKKCPDCEEIIQLPHFSRHMRDKHGK